MFKPSTDATEKFESIQSIAIKLVTEQMKLMQVESGPKERTIFILGSKGVGKSAIINKFFDREENSRPTLALEYSFGRRSGHLHSNDKQILNVWELGCLDNSNQLIEVPLRSHSLEKFSAIIVIDLSQPNRLWSDLECALKGLKQAYSKQANDTDATAAMQKSKAEVRISKEHPDLATLELFPFSIVIVGGKYDIFQDFDPEIKKHVCRCLRSISHAIGAALLFYSQKITNLSKTMRDTVSHLGFGSPTNPFRSTATDYNGPIMIWFGLDSWEKIGVTPSNSERIGVTFNAEITQVNKSETQTMADDPAKDPGFRESLIDEMRAQKDEELMTLIRDTEIRSKFETVIS